MSNIKSFKRLAEKIPPQLSYCFTWIPYSIRFGPAYIKARRDISFFRKLNEKAKQEWIFNKMKKVVSFAYNSVSFYRYLYDKGNFHPALLRSFTDIQRIPIVTRECLQDYPIEIRSNNTFIDLRLNTGGTSGEPLEFYVDSGAFAREWAHMLYIWQRANYRAFDFKITFRGKNLGKRPLKYNLVHNEFLINAYAPYTKITKELQNILGKYKIRFIHGYPSSIYEFTRHCLEFQPELIKDLGKTLKAILLASEFPAPIYRHLIEHAFRVKSISWYGHSEMAVLAYEEEKYIYSPLHTYGYCEAVSYNNDEYRLVGTSFENMASPFIRYDTGDLIKPINKESILSKFQISSGRVGEFIIDAKGKRISLTGLIFGRHHSLFSWVKFIQVRQDRPGHAIIILTVPENQMKNIHEIGTGFDSADVAIDFNFELRTSPIRSSTGKVPLLIR
jgi:phenylacetate-CoA ligase